MMSRNEKGQENHPMPIGTIPEWKGADISQAAPYSSQACWRQPRHPVQAGPEVNTLDASCQHSAA